MSTYLLSVHSVEGTESDPRSPEEMEAFMERVMALESEMQESGTFVFGGGLHGPDTATVVQRQGGDLVTTDGPFSEAKEHIGGFYVIEAEDLDEALAWAGKVVDAIEAPIEVRPFAALSGA